MDVTFLNDAAYVRGADLDLELTLIQSAQTFCWREHDGAYYAVLNGRPVGAAHIGDAIRFSPCDEIFFSHIARYFDLDGDYNALAREFSWFFAMEEMFSSLRGLRCLHQDPFETLVMFILSANNNVARIRQLTLKLSDAFGEAFEADGYAFRAMPTPEALFAAGTEALRELGCGYRDRYLTGASEMVLNGFDLMGLRGLNYEDAHSRLLTLPGVGDKVADCIQLLSLGHTMAFPVDTWVEKLLLSWFPNEFRGLSRRKMAQKARQFFGERAGVFQQFLFHSARAGVVAL